MGNKGKASPEIKLKLVEQVRAGKLSLSQAAKEAGVYIASEILTPVPANPLISSLF